MELLTVMVVVRDRHTEGGMMITNHDHHTTVTKHRFPALLVLTLCHEHHTHKV